MYCTFYRPINVKIHEFESIIGKLSYDLHKLETEQTDEWDVYTYFYALSRHAQPLAKNPGMRFLGLAEPESMPSDARIDYFYRPTYIATAFMMKAVLLYPGLMDEETFLDSELEFSVAIVKETLKSCMLGCTGRGFDGADVLPLKDCVKIFCGADADIFLKKYPDLCPAFTALYHQSKAVVDRDEVNPHNEWPGHD